MEKKINYKKITDLILNYHFNIFFSTNIYIFFQKKFMKP